jgi:hypothetical protein
VNNFKEYACEICGTACHKPSDYTYSCIVCGHTGHFEKVDIEALEVIADQLISDMLHNDGTIFELEKENDFIKKKLEFMGSDGQYNNNDE